MWKRIEAPETFVSSHFAIPFTHPLNPQNLAQGWVTAAALQLVGAGLELAHISACEAIDQACTVRQLANPLTLASSFNTTSGADTERIQRILSLLSPSVQPCSMARWVLASKQRPQIAAWKLALCVCRKKQSLHGGSWLDSAAPLFAQKSW